MNIKRWIHGITARQWAISSVLFVATMITTTDSLRQHVDRWQHEDLLAIDTESNSLHAYQEQVCLIQLSTRETDFIIDPLMVENLDPLGDLVADSGIGARPRRASEARAHVVPLPCR